jgi:hypothetical protein
VRVYTKQFLVPAASCVIRSPTNIHIVKTESSTVKTEPVRGGTCHVYKLVKK